MLGFFGEGQEKGNIIMKNSFVFWDWFSRGVKLHILMIQVLLALPFSVEAMPRPLESAATPHGDGITELNNCSLQVRERSAKKTADVLGPIKAIGVDGAKLSKDSDSEFDRSGLKGNVPLNRKNTKDANKSNNDRNSPSWDDYIQAILLGIFAVLIPAAPMFMSKPNVK